MIKRLIAFIFWWYYESEVSADTCSKEERESIYALLASDPDIAKFLRAVAHGDKTRYFHAKTQAERNKIKGEYIRTMFLVKQIDSHKKVIDKAVGKSILGGRYS